MSRSGARNVVEMNTSSKHKKRTSKRQHFDTQSENMTDQQRLGKEKRITKHDLIQLHPKNPRQEKFVEAYRAGVPIIMQSGFAGTGKTAMAISEALQELVDPTNDYEKIVIVRSAVSTRDIGFLKGTLEEKQAVYEAAYEDAFSATMKFNAPYQIMKALGKVEFKLTSYLRGTNLENSIIIFDEAQNTDRAEFLSVCTRMNESSRMVICGDGRQDDLRRKRAGSSFSFIEKVFDYLPDECSAHIEYEVDDCLRHGIVRLIMMADAEIPD